MSRLEDLTPGAAVKGILPNGLGTVTYSGTAPRHWNYLQNARKDGLPMSSAPPRRAANRGRSGRPPLEPSMGREGSSAPSTHVVAKAKSASTATKRASINSFFGSKAQKTAVLPVLL